MSDHSALGLTARPYMRARKNDVHIPMAYDYALRLLEAHPLLDSEVVSLQVGYPGEVIDRVVEIIDGHDTRAEALSPEDELVKDADALWRFSVAGIAVACDWFGLTPGEYADRTEPQIEGRLFTETARAIARAELADTRRVLRTAELAGDRISTCVRDLGL